MASHLRITHNTHELTPYVSTNYQTPLPKQVNTSNHSNNRPPPIQNKNILLHSSILNTDGVPNAQPQQLHNFSTNRKSQNLTHTKITYTSPKRRTKHPPLPKKNNPTLASPHFKRKCKTKFTFAKTIKCQKLKHQQRSSHFPKSLNSCKLQYFQQTKKKNPRFLYTTSHFKYKLRPLHE